MGDARKTYRYGQTRTEGCLYFLITAFLIGVIGFMFHLFIPGNEYHIGDFTFYISHDFFLNNILWFLTGASMIGLGIGLFLTKIHQYSVKKRIKRLLEPGD